MITKLAIAGAGGRMGRRLVALAAEDDSLKVTAALVESIDPKLGVDVEGAESGLKYADSLTGIFDVLIDFTLAAGTMTCLEHCVAGKSAMVIGTTGHSPDQLKKIEQAARAIPIVKATNFSLGVNIMIDLVAQMAKSLGDGYDIELIEHHHKRKIDAPSGTAVSLLDSLINAKGWSKEDLVHGREGETGQRPAKQIGVHAVRMGDIVGHHEVHFSGPGETLTIRHTAGSRDVFAAGALRAAKWVAGRAPGMYTMKDVIQSA
jgi:4-hydroxy-tetrahydrodipicolinate reductase